MMKLNKWFITLILSVLYVNVFSQKKTQDDLKIGLVLSGGGAKGYAHVGVLKVIEESGLKIDYIGGTSMGAIVGGLYASGYNAEQLEEIIKEIDFNELIFNEKQRKDVPFFNKEFDDKYLLSLAIKDSKLSLPKGLSKGQGTLNLLSEYLSHTHNQTDFTRLDIPFICIGTDLETGKQKIFNSGFLPKAVMASGAYPTLFNPLEIDGHFYTDGGVVNNFPVQEVMDMGANFIIGIDLGEGLMPYEDLTDVTRVIEQIISFGIENKTEEQRGKVDVHIKPQVEGISVTNFELKDSIVNQGFQSGLQVKPIFDSLAKIHPASKRKSIEIKKEFLISDIQIEGLIDYSRNYTLGKLKIKMPKTVTYQEIKNAISALYATGNFERIDHKIIPTENGNQLYIEVKETDTKYYAKFSLHYDELFKSSLLANFSSRNLISFNSFLSVDLIFGDNPRYNFNYFVDNGIKPSFGLNAYYQGFELAVPFVDNPDIFYNYDLDNFVNQIFAQSTLADRYAIGIGMEHNYLKIRTNNLTQDNPFQTVQNAGFFIPYAFLKADNRDDINFPTTGFYLNAEFDYFLHSNQPNFEKTSTLKANAQFNFPLFQRFTIQTAAHVGITFFNDVPNGFNFIIGGLNQQEILNTTPFNGLPFGYASNKNLLGFNANLQYRIAKNHFLTYHANLANLTDEFNQIKLFDYEYTGHGLGYGYRSPFGPISASLNYSPNADDVIFYVALGHWF